MGLTVKQKKYEKNKLVLNVKQKDMAKRNFTIDEMREILLEYGICTEEYINGAICVGGMIPQTFERVLEYHTGYNSFELYLEDLDDMED